MKKKILSLMLVISILASLFFNISTTVLAWEEYLNSGIYTYTVSNEKATIVWVSHEASGILEIPSTLNGYPVISIAQNTFSGNQNITKVVIPDSITSIGSGAFYHCTGLESITIPASVTSIEPETFFRCTSLTSVTIRSGVTSVGEKAFESCTSLRSITIPNSVTSIGASAFESCTSLRSITIPNSVTSIGASAFESCTSLRSITVPNSVTSIGVAAFRGCKAMTSVTVPGSVISIGTSAFNGCTGLISVTILDGVRSIGLFAFSWCTSLRSITIPNSVTSIEASAFESCTGLESITIPSGLTSIEMLTFADCSGLTSVTIPDSITKIKSSAFNNCNNIESVYYTGSADNWKKISIDFLENNCLTNATIHYNHIPGTEYIPNQNVNIKPNQNPAHMPVNINMVTINGKGTAYGRFKILNQDGIPVKKKVVNYSVDGGAKTSVTTDNYGYAMVKIAGITKSKNYNIAFSGNGISTTTGILIVTVEPLHFKSGVESSIQRGVNVGAGLEVGAEFGKLQAKAGVASVGLDGSEKNSLSFEQEYANNKHKITLSSKTNYSAAAQAKLGLFAGIELPNVAGIDGELISVNGKAGYGRFVGVSYEDEDFKYTDSQDILDLSKFMLSAFIGTQQGNVATEYIAQILDTPINAYEKGSVINLEGGASTGTIELKKGEVKGGVTLSGINAKSVWTNSTKTKNDKSQVYSTELAAGSGTKLFDTSIGYSKAKTSLGSISDFINDNLKFSATEDKDGNLKEISLSSKQSGDDGSFLYKKTETTAKKITYKDEAAEKVANTDNELKKFVNGDKAYFSKAQMNNAINKIINSSESGIYSQTQNTKEALSLDLSASFKLLLKLGGKYGLSGATYYEYESENGIYENGTAYIQAENDIKNTVEDLTISFDEMLDYSKDAINNILSSVWDTVKGLADQAVEYGQAVVENVKDTVTGWVVSITKAVNPIHSVAILAIEDEVSLFSTSSLATTIGEPYIISVEDEKGNEINDFSENPLTLTLSYTEEQLYEAGVTDIDSISVVRWDDDKGVYVKQDGTHNKENACITLEILKPGQYILAVDNCAPAVTQFEVTGKGQSPEIYAVVSDMSGIQEFKFSIDNEELLNNSNFDEYYNYITGEFYYTAKDLAEGDHTATIYATDTFGNEIEESVSFSIDNSIPEILNVTEVPQVITDNMTISANVTNASDSSVMLNTELTDIYGNTETTTVDMVELNGMYTAELPEIKNGYSVNVWVSAYSEAGNGSESEKQQAIVMKTNDSDPIIAITKIEGNNVSVKCSGIDDYEGKIAYLGVYNDDGRLLQLKIMDMAEDVAFTDVTEKGYVKVFVWNKNLSPICSPVEVEKQ